MHKHAACLSMLTATQVLMLLCLCRTYNGNRIAVSPCLRLLSTCILLSSYLADILHVIDPLRNSCTAFLENAVHVHTDVADCRSALSMSFMMRQASGSGRMAMRCAFLQSNIQHCLLKAQDLE